MMPPTPSFDQIATETIFREKSLRLEIATKIAAGFSMNNSVNCNEVFAKLIAEYSMICANELIRLSVIKIE